MGQSLPEMGHLFDCHFRYLHPKILKIVRMFFYVEILDTYRWADGLSR